MRSQSLVTLGVIALLAAVMAAPASAQDKKLTGLDRARQVSLQAIERANGRMAEARGEELPPGLSGQDKVTGRARAAQAIAAAMERGNGNGNAYGRGNALRVLEALLSGESPATIEDAPNHGQNVRAMVRAYNELKKQQRDAG